MADLRGLPASLASTLAAEVDARGVEQCSFLMVGRKSGQKSVVLVTTTDRASETLLEFLDGLSESGVVVRAEADQDF